MIVEDSLIVRGLFTRWLESDGDVRVVKSVPDGAQAVAQLADCRAEVVILDIDMPVMDGLEALPKLLAVNPAVKVVMSSTLTLRNAQISLKALSLGASDYITKPETTRGVTSSETFRHELAEKVKALGAAARGLKAGALQPAASGALAGRQHAPAPRLRMAPIACPLLIAIGCSTGGPQALVRLLGKLGPNLTVPILITQHMPAMFTAILAEHLARVTHRPTKEAITGEIPEAGTIYVAPGGHHLLARRQGGDVILQVDDGPPENFCKPAVDPMFRSLASAYGPDVLAVVLTGMGHDGREGARAIVDAGGSIIVQDQPTSVVWGMPGAIAEAGLASAVLPLEEIAPKLIDLMKGKRA